MNQIDEILRETGFAKAGGIWGAAAWRKHKNKVYALGQGPQSDYLNAPIELDAPTKLWIYQGPFHSDFWIHDGEPPLDMIGNPAPFITFNFPSLIAALRSIGGLINYAAQETTTEYVVHTTIVDLREITL